MNKIVVYYRSLPSSLEDFVKLDGKMTLIKDGLKACGNHKCPRLTIKIDEKDKYSDHKRIDSLERLLFELLKNNQIINYKKIN